VLCISIRHKYQVFKLYILVYDVNQQHKHTLNSLSMSHTTYCTTLSFLNSYMGTSMDHKDRLKWQKPTFNVEKTT